MVDSKYYKNLYDQKGKEEKKYDQQWKELRDIYNNLVDKQDTRVSRVNTEYSRLNSTIGNAVRYNYQFDSIARKVSNKHENDPYYEYKLSRAIYAIDDEMQRKKNQREEAKIAKENYKDQYKQKKNEEIQEFWNSVWNK